jgi:uncharacterized membrane protein YccC
MTAPNPRIERVLALTERLTEALKADIKALEQGRPREMRTIEPETQQLAALYGREAASINAATIKSLPAPVRAKLAEATARFQDALKLQSRLITRMKNASEGIVRAIATDVERKRNATRPYGRTPTPMPRPASALLYNGVV